MLSDSKREKFKKAIAPLYNVYGTDYKDIIEKIREIKWTRSAKAESPLL